MNQQEDKQCLNCGHSLQSGDQYCATCGQRDEPAVPGLRQWLSEFLGDYFTFDAKLWRSVGPLLLRPGFLTIAYREGKHVKYIPPLRMFLFLSVVLVLLLNYTLDTNQLMNGVTASDEGGQISLMQMDDTGSPGNKPLSVDSVIQALYPKHAPAAIADTLLSGRPEANEFTRIIVSQIITLQVTRGASLTSYLIRNTTLILSVLLISLAVALWIVNRRLRYPFLAHVVASLHIHAVLLLVLIVLQAAGLLITNYSFWIIAGIMGLYVFLAVRNAYRHPRGMVLRPITVTLVYIFVLLPFTFIMALATGFILM